MRGGEHARAVYGSRSNTSAGCSGEAVVAGECGGVGAAGRDGGPRSWL